MVARLCSLLVWAAVAATAVGWGWRLSGRGAAVPPQAVTAQAAPVVGGDLSRLLGQPPTVPVEAEPVVAAESRFRLVGVVAPRTGAAGTGLALISVDGKPARAVAAGRELEPGLRLITVGHRQVQLGGSGAAPMTLVLPPLPEANRGRPGDGMAGGEGLPQGVPGAPGMAGIPALPPGMAAQQQRLLMQQQQAMAQAARMQPVAPQQAPGVMVQPEVVEHPIDGQPQPAQTNLR